MHTNPDVLALRALGEDVGEPLELAHLESCPVCFKEVAVLARLTDVGRSATARDAISAPSPEVWKRIRAELGFNDAGSLTTPSFSPLSGQLPNVSSISSRPRQHAAGAGVAGAGAAGPVNPGSAGPPIPNGGPRRRTSAARRLAALAVAAVLTLIVGVGVGIGYERQIAKPFERVIARANLNASPRWAGASGTAEVMADGRGRRTLVLRMATPKPVVGTRTVWLVSQRNKGMTLMGTMNSDGVATIEIPRGMSLLNYPVVEVSAEPVNDPQPATRSGDSIVTGELE